MPFEKGKSGNVRGRPKQTAEQKAQREQFKKLLQSSTVSALENIIKIANDKKSKDCFNASKYIIDKAYGTQTAFLLEDAEKDTPLIVKVVPYGKNKDDVYDEEWENWEDDEIE